MATDEELAARLARGDAGALAQLLARYERPLSAFLYRQTRGRDVEDLYQETWLRVVRAAHNFDPGRRFSTWLFQIAVNLCRDWQRRPPPEPRESAELGSADPVAGMDARLEVERLLEQLPELHREVVVLRYFHDLSEREIAEIVDCPRGTVKSRLHNALRKLAELVERGPR